MAAPVRTRPDARNGWKRLNRVLQYTEAGIRRLAPQTCTGSVVARPRLSPLLNARLLAGLREQMAEGDAKDGLGELGFESNAFETLERDFQEVLTELVGDKSLERFRQEYEKLHRALKKSHDSEKRLIKKCRELNSEIVSNAAKVQTALKLSQEDQNTISSLKREIEKARKPRVEP